MLRIRMQGVFLVFLAFSMLSCGRGDPAERWWKGNTHTHTLWSDGDAAPEKVADWYVAHGYDFLVLSDHNVLSEGTRWFPVTEEGEGRLTHSDVDSLRRRFGEEWVETRRSQGGLEMRLKTLQELRERFKSPGDFLFIQGEELTDAFDGAPVHLNGLNLEERIPPQGGDSVTETLQNNVDAVNAQGKRTGREVLAHVNHPNFGWALSPVDVAAVKGARFFEVYNGHPAVNNHGDEEHPDTGRIWDIALTLRLTELDLGLLYGLATDDAHHYSQWGPGHANPGRGWVMVRARGLDPAALIRALQAGDFYSSSGVVLEDVRRRGEDIVVEVAAEPGVTYTTCFIGTRRRGEHTGPVGEVLKESTGERAVYRFRGDELYVRAEIVSSRPHPNPHAEGDLERAWVQPVLP